MNVWGDECLRWWMSGWWMSDNRLKRYLAEFHLNSTCVTQGLPLPLWPQLSNWPKLSNCDFIFTPVWHSHNISPQASWVLETLNHINHNRADPGEVRRALPEDNRTNRLSHAFRSQIWMSCISFGIKPNVQEHFSRDGENWQEGLLLEINIALCMIWPDLIFVIFFYATAFLGLKIVRQKVC